MFLEVALLGLLSAAAAVAAVAPPMPVEAPIPRGAESLRCGVWLVTLGALPETVESACGEPTEKLNLKRTFRVRGMVVMTIKEEVWTYDFGSTRLVRVLVFSNGVVSSIASGKHGTSP